MSFTATSPRSIITLKIAKDKTIFVTETPVAVRALVNGAPDDRLLVLTRWTGRGLSEFNTRADNIVNVEENR